MGELVRSIDWSATPIGPVEQWSPSLQALVGFLLVNRFPLLLWWGPQYIQIYNDAYRPIPGAKHPKSMGQPASECWHEIWHILQPLIDTPFQGGPSTWIEDMLLEINRHGFTEETHFTVAYSPVPDETAPRGIGGVLATVHEITEKIVGERRVAALRDLGARAIEAKTAEAACAAAAATLASYPRDVPFALIYLIDEDGAAARLAGAAGIAPGTEASPLAIRLDGNADARSWPLAEVISDETSLVVDDLARRFADPMPGPWPDPPDTAMLLPIRSSAGHRLAGVLIAGTSPRLQLDELYRSFLDLVAAQIASAVASARAYEEERRRAEALAEIDRAKTAFFSNASHEFRTPLTLLLSPLEELLLRGADGASVPVERAELELMHRNGLRLLKLVNTLLDFSRIEAGRFEAVYEPTDLAAMTAELASTFRSAMERAGLGYRVDCKPVGEPVYVARDLWEKIVLNLLANAFKYTLAGEVAIGLCRVGSDVELAVRDTGIGIPARELPRLFERFHRVEGQRGRSQEGTGIGLALVHELVRMHGGRVAVESGEGGSLFTVTLPLGTAHLPAERIGAARTLATTEIGAEAFVGEALRWLDAEPGIAPAIEEPALDPAVASPMPLVLVADDNADMRLYVRRLLSPRYRVIAVADGAAALEAARRDRPDLILSDVMMPRLDGFGLLAAVRADPALREIPVILLSARAGEEARVEGVTAGADDYMTKPFAARELLARVGANLDMARLRRRAAEDAEAHAAELRTLLETVPAAVWLTKDPQASRIWGNRYAAQLLRVDEHANPSLSGPGHERPRHFKIFRDGAEAELATLPMQRAAMGEEVRGDEIDIRFEDGATLTLLAHAAPVRDSAGRVAGAICAGIDITSRKHAEAALRVLNETLEERVALEADRRRNVEGALRQAQKMEAIGQLTGGVAHDMNNLLMVIQGSLEIIERQLPATGNPGMRWRRPLQSALGGVERAAALTQRLLAFARRQSLDPKAIDPNRLVAGMSDLLRRTLGEAIVIENVLDDRVWAVFADPNQLENAILNLAVNARDAMPDGGALTLETANIGFDANDVERSAEPGPGDYVTISVKDTGTGMSPEAVERAFEPFFTTKEMGKGTGLGLSQVYGFVKQSGGHVEIDSAPGRGTTVRIYLPRHVPGRAERFEEGAVPPEIPTGNVGESVLVVEDDDAVRASNVESLRELGYHVVEAGNGADALRLVETLPSIGLLFTDIGLPGGIDGRALADNARRLRPSLRVLFTTGYGREPEAGNGPVGGPATMLAKPFGFAALAAKVREALDR
ncbi:MAG TPA: ATP-binding protein [Stellaceae bacterium]